MGEAEAAEALSASKRRGAAAFTGLDGPPTRGNGPGTRVTRISQDWLESRPASPPLGGEVGCQGRVVSNHVSSLGKILCPPDGIPWILGFNEGLPFSPVEFDT